MANPIQLADINSRIVDVCIKMPYGEVELPIYIPSLSEWNEIGYTVPEPVVPRTLAGAPGQPPQPNPYDREYLQERIEVEDRRIALRLAFALTKAGNVLPGDTLGEQADALSESIDIGVARSLRDFLVDVAYDQKKERVTARARTFQPGRDHAAEDTTALAADAGAVEQPAGT